MILKTLNKKHMLSVALVVAGFGIATAANAAIDGAYLGGQLGWGNVNQGDFAKPNTPAAGTINSTSSSSNSGGLAGRIFAGYQFMQNFAAELGYMKFHNATAKYSSTSTAGSTISNLNESGTVRTHAIDLVGKGILPLNNGFNVYGKLGLAYLAANGSATGTLTTGGVSSPARVSENAHKVYPEFGVGTSYDITKNISADLSYNRIQKVGHSTQLQSTNFVGAGLAYNFG